jgi:hypothetical protein
MNLAARCREAITHVAAIKKELTIQKRKALVYQQQLAELKKSKNNNNNNNNNKDDSIRADNIDICSHSNLDPSSPITQAVDKEANHQGSNITGTEELVVKTDDKVTADPTQLDSPRQPSVTIEGGNSELPSPITPVKGKRVNEVTPEDTPERFSEGTVNHCLSSPPMRTISLEEEKKSMDSPGLSPVPKADEVIPGLRLGSGPLFPENDEDSPLKTKRTQELSMEDALVDMERLQQEIWNSKSLLVDKTGSKICQDEEPTVQCADSAGGYIAAANEEDDILDLNSLRRIASLPSDEMDEKTGISKRTSMSNSSKQSAMYKSKIVSCASSDSEHKEDDIRIVELPAEARSYKQQPEEPRLVSSDDYEEDGSPKNSESNTTPNIHSKPPGDGKSKSKVIYDLRHKTNPLTVEKSTITSPVDKKEAKDSWDDEEEGTDDVVPDLSKATTPSVKKAFFPHPASPKASRYHNGVITKNDSYDEEMPSDIIITRSKSGRKLKAEGKSDLLSSIDAFEASFNTNFPDSFSPREGNTPKSDDNSPKSESFYDPFDTSSPVKSNFLDAGTKQANGIRERAAAAFQRYGNRRNKVSDCLDNGTASNSPSTDKESSLAGAAMQLSSKLKGMPAVKSSQSSDSLGKPNSAVSSQNDRVNVASMRVDERPPTAASRLQGQTTSTISATSEARSLNTVQVKQHKISGGGNGNHLYVATSGHSAERPNRPNSFRSSNSTKYELAPAKDLSPSDLAIVSPNVSVKEKAAFFSSPCPREGRVSWRPSSHPGRSLEDEGDIPMQTRSSPGKVATSSRNMSAKNTTSGIELFERQLKVSTATYGSRPNSTKETSSHSVFRGSQPVFNKNDAFISAGNVSDRFQPNGRQRRNVNMSQIGTSRTVRPVSERREL